MWTLVALLAMAAAAKDPAIWNTRGSITFASADGDDVWLIDAGTLESPVAHLVRIGPAGAVRVASLPGPAFSPVADAEHVYVVAGKDLLRVDKRSPHAMKTMVAGEVWPIGVAVDSESVYLANQTTQGLAGGPPGGKPGSVAKIKKTGGAVVRLTSETARGIVVDAENVYFASGTSVRAVGKRGGPTRALVSDIGATPSLALDGEWLIYTRDGGVSRVHTRSGKVEQLAGDIDIPLFVAASAGAVYVGANMAFQGPGTPPRPAEVLRLRPGGEPERLWSSLNRLTAMVVAGPAVYVASEPMAGDGGGKVHRIEISAKR